MSVEVRICCLFAVAGVTAGPRLSFAAPADGVPFSGKVAYSVAASRLVTNPTALTVAAWVKVADSKSPQVFVNCGPANGAFTLYLFKGNVRMLIGHAPPKYAFALAPAPPAGCWVHYAGSYDGKTITVYMDGKRQASVKAPGKIDAKGKPLFIGALDASERFLRGRMDDVRVWSRTLGDEEVAAVAAGREAGGLETGLAGWWTKTDLGPDAWKSRAPAALTATRVEKTGLILNRKDDGYRGIWYFNQPSNDEYVYKYSGGLGTYCAKHIPFAWYVKEADKTFFVYGGAKRGTNTHLVHMVSYFDHKTGLVPRPTILLDKRTDDAHDNPVINVDDRGTIWIFSSSHGTGRPSYISRSLRPYSVDEFTCVWTGNFSYPQPWFVPGKGFLLMHTYYTQGRTNAMMTSSDGVAWSERRLLSRIGEGHYQVSRPWKDTKVGAAFNYHPKGKGLNWRTNLYYMETADFGRTWRTIRGELLHPMLTEIKNPALVADYERQRLNVYLKDITYDAQGRPIILYITSKGFESGPKNMPRTWTTARWTGTEWDIRGGDIVSDNNYDTGSLYIEAEDSWRIIGPTQPGPQPYNPGGEVAMWLSQDQGGHWKMVRQMTSGSEYNHTYVRRPVNAHPDFYALWADGHGRRPSESRLYFCNKKGDVFRLPYKMNAEFERPQKIN